MDLNDTPELAEYRAKVRSWLEQHASEAPQRRGREEPFRHDLQRDEIPAVHAYQQVGRRAGTRVLRDEPVRERDVLLVERL